MDIILEDKFKHTHTKHILYDPIYLRLNDREN